MIPLGLETVATKYFYSYADAPTDDYVMQKTAGAHFRGGKIGEYDIMADTFISKFVPKGHTQISGISRIQELYEVGVTTRILPQPSILFTQFELDSLFSCTTHNYQGNENSVLYYKAFRPIETIKLSTGLMPSEEQREYKRLLGEVKDLLEKMQKEDDIKTAKLIADRDIQENSFQKMLEDLR